jgi:hypothetical protein
MLLDYGLHLLEIGDDGLRLTSVSPRERLEASVQPPQQLRSAEISAGRQVVPDL